MPEVIKQESTFEYIKQNANHLFSLKKKFGDKKKAQFYREFSILLKAGVDVKYAMELYASSCKAEDKRLFQTIITHLISGKALNEAFLETSKFTNYEIHSIRVGEDTGRLYDILIQLSLFYERKINLRRQVVNLSTYPAFVFAVAVGVVFFMLNNVVPMFADIFNRFNSELPAITQYIISLSRILNTYGVFILCALILVAVYLYTQRNKPWFRKNTSLMVMRIPVIGVNYKKLILARFSQSMYLLSGSKVPLTESVDYVRQMINCYPVEVALSEVKSQLVVGAPFYQSISKYAIFEPRMVALIKVAEEVNQLEFMFKRLSDQYNADVEHQTKVMSSLIEPVMILFIAVFVGIILVSLYLPLFKLSTTMQ